VYTEYTLFARRDFVYLEGMPSKRPAILLRLDPDVHATIVKAAKHDERSAQYVLERIVLDWLRTNSPEDVLKKRDVK
jgi:hypothetical protein